jgi:hypothetical protein
MLLCPRVSTATRGSTSSEPETRSARVSWSHTAHFTVDRRCYIHAMLHNLLYSLLYLVHYTAHRTALCSASVGRVFYTTRPRFGGGSSIVFLALELAICRCSTHLWLSHAYCSCTRAYYMHMVSAFSIDLRTRYNVVSAFSIDLRLLSANFFFT